MLKKCSPEENFKGEDKQIFLEQKRPKAQMHYKSQTFNMKTHYEENYL